LFFSNSSDDSTTSSIITKVKNFFDPKKPPVTKQQQAQNELAHGLDQLTKDAPLPIKLMGKLMKPLLNRTVADVTAQQEKIELILIRGANLISKELNSSQSSTSTLIKTTLSTPHMSSSSSSSSTINGKSTTTLQISSYINNFGQANSGVAEISVSNEVIIRIKVTMHDGTKFTINGGKEEGFIDV